MPKKSIESGDILAMLGGFIASGIFVILLNNFNFWHILKKSIHFSLNIFSFVIIFLWYLTIIISNFLRITIQQLEDIEVNLKKNLPEDYMADLATLIERWKKQKLSEREIKLKTFFCLIVIFKADLQCQIENIWLNRNRIE